MKQQELIEVATRIDKALAANKLSQAKQLAKKLVSANRSAGLAYLGVVALREEKLDECERVLLESYSINNAQNLALANLIPLYMKKRDFGKAIAYGEQAFARMPQNKSVTINYAAALLQEQQYTKVIEILNPLLDLEKPNVSIVSGLISAYRSTFRYDKAKELLAIADTHFPDHQDVARLKADTFAESDPFAALESFKRALEIRPDNVPTLWNMSLVQLRTGDFNGGWINYDHGLSHEVGKIGRPLPKLFQGTPVITDLKNLDKEKWTFATCEQGIGDQILFLGSLPQLHADFPKLALICERRMAPILARSFPAIPMYEYGLGPMLAYNPSIVNGIVPIGSIQKYYRNSREAYLEHRQAYLVPNAGKVERYRDALLQKVGGRKLIGFSWKGGYWERSQKTKTLEIELWDPLFQEHPDCIFVCLQYGEVAKEKEYLTKKYKNVRFIDGIDFKKDLDSWHALACACHEIVSVSTALVHFAGASGVRIHLLLSEKGAPFIWQLEGEEAICYPNVSIYRKRVEQTASDFFNGVARKMRAI
ncbi:MAG: tetratricopeptide repeat protein [Betaproteobacteria bacterium]|nr:tetratricopeptide repeat protein [Betaproteobacteria bacterium]